MNDVEKLKYHEKMNHDEKDIILNFIYPDHVVVDVGACVGYYTIAFAEKCKEVYAFEPSKQNFEQLRKNTTHLKNIDLYNYAVSDSFEIVDLYLCDNDTTKGINWGMNRLYPSQWWNSGKKQKISTVKLDDFLSDLTNINFVKIDVEGWEYHVLLGMKNIIEKFKPILFLEFHIPSLVEANTNPKDIFDFLKTKNYMIHVLINKELILVNEYRTLERYTKNTPAINIFCI